MKRFFNSGKGSLKDKGDEFQELSLDILLAHKEDVNTKLKNEYKSFITRKLEIEKDLVEVEKHEILLRYFKVPFFHNFHNLKSKRTRNK